MVPRGCNSPNSADVHRVTLLGEAGVGPGSLFLSSFESILKLIHYFNVPLFIVLSDLFLCRYVSDSLIFHVKVVNHCG